MKKNQYISSNIRNETKVLTFSILLNVVFKILAREIRQEKGMKDAQVEQ